MSEEPRGPGAFSAGSLIGGYRLEEQIGRGGMAIVFRAFDPRLNRRVALKIHAPTLTHDHDFRQRFIRESRAAAAVDDPHIIPVFEAGEADGVLFIAMRLARGGDLCQLLNREGRLPPERAVDIVSQVASALDSAHAAGLLHRDVKPANMLLDGGTSIGRDHVYLSDFGLTKKSMTAGGLTGSGQWLGTVDYVAPEQIQGLPVDGRADLYALGCATFELLTGAPPFRRNHDIAVIYAQVNEPPPLLSSRRIGLPLAANAVLSRVLAKSPDDRYPNGRAFVAALHRALDLDPADSGPRPQSHDTPLTRITAPVPRPPAATPSTTVTAHYASPQATPGSAGPPAGSQRGAGQPGKQPEGEQRGSRSPRWPRWRSPSLAAAACIVIGLAVAGYFVSSRGTSSGAATRDGITGLTAPGCTTSAPKFHTLSRARQQISMPIPGKPFAAQESKDGRFTFVTADGQIDVLRNRSGLPPKLLRIVPAPHAKRGLIMTSDGKYLIAVGGPAAVVINVKEAEQGAPHPVVGTMSSPHGSGAIGVLLSPDGKYLFVTLEPSNKIAVFDFRKFLIKGFIQVGEQPVALGMSPDGLWLYATSFRPPVTQRPVGSGPNDGVLSVINMATAEADPAKSVPKMVKAGCSPTGIQVQGSTGTVWVIARDSNALLGFSVSKLLHDRAHALVALVRVGRAPTGLTLTPSQRIIVADSEQVGSSGAPGALAVISTADALAGKPAVLGVIPAAGQPGRLTLVENGTTLLVTRQVTGELRVVDVTHLP